MTPLDNRADPIPDIDLASPGIHHAVDMEGVFAELRREQPVFWHGAKSYTGFWAVTRYADTVRVYRDTDTFSAAYGMTLDSLTPHRDPGTGMMVEVTDPPEHRRLRRSIGAFFPAGAVSEMERQVDDLVVRLLTDVRARNEPVDFVAAVASRVPMYVAGVLLGLPAEDLDWITERTSRVFLLDAGAADSTPSRQRAKQAGEELLGYFSKLARSSWQRKGPPSLVQRLATGTGDREGLTTGEAILNANNLTIAGTQTTRCSLTNMLLALVRFPDSFQDLRKHPALVSMAVEESVRWANPMWHLTRTAVQDVVLGGQAIKAGDPVVVFPFSANRDEEVFELPHVFNIRRHPNPHIGFATGPHGCPGSGMGRLQMRTVLARMAELFADVELAGELQPISSNFLRSYVHLPVRFTPSFPALWDARCGGIAGYRVTMDTDLADVLLSRADKDPGAIAYEGVGLSGAVVMMTYAQLAARASALAGKLTGCDDGLVLLAYPAGLDYVVAVFAAFLAGRAVVPGYPPGASSGPGRSRLTQMIRDASPAVAISPAPHPELTVPVILAVPGAEADDTTWRRAGHADGQHVAIVQYTSGSTARPRGVLVRHESVTANTAAIAQRFGLTPQCRALSWLPPFHDMGLIGGLLTPMKAGIPARILQPGDFLKAPLWWLRQITDSGATASGGPNFAFELCLRRARTAEAFAGLDLSRWRVAFNGGEPVKERTLAEFAERFAPVGFRPESFVPCYGLAEATLMVSAGHWAPGRGAAAGQRVVSCGVPVAGQRVVVVEPDSLMPAEEDAEGELWITGPNVTHGYLSGEEPGLFGFLDGTRFLRTGDLGYARDGELFLTGRAKDVIVFRGVNYHAIDIETAALEEVGATGRMAAAFAIDTDRGTVPALVVEMPGSPGESLAATIRAGVLSRTNLKLGIVALVPPRSLPRTSSGKVQRSACRAALLAGAFDSAVVSDRALLASLADSGARDDAATELAAMICGIVAGVCEEADCRPADSLADLGVDSVQAAEAAAVLEDALGLAVPLEVFLLAPTPRGAADALMERWLADGHLAGTVRDRLVTAGNSVGAV